MECSNCSGRAAVRCHEERSHLLLASTGNEAESSLFSISHSISVDGKHGFGLGKAGRVVNLTDPGFASAFSQVQSVGRRNKAGQGIQPASSDRYRQENTASGHGHGSPRSSKRL